jgi:hypothetical protein
VDDECRMDGIEHTCHLVRTHQVVHRHRDRAETPARAVENGDLVAVGRLPGDGGAGTDAVRLQAAGDARDRLGERRGGDSGEEDVE